MGGNKNVLAVSPVVGIEHTFMVMAMTILTFSKAGKCRIAQKEEETGFL